MIDILDIITNIDTIYNGNSSLSILKDFERVLDELDLYVFKNWEDGELASGPNVSRHWVECSFLWPQSKMPDPEGAKRLYEYGCQVKYKKDILIKPRKILKPADVRPNSRKGKLDSHPIWIVEINIPKKLMLEVYRGYINENEPKANEVIEQPTDQVNMGTAQQMGQTQVGGGGM